MTAARFITSVLAGLLFSLMPTFSLAKAPMAKAILWEISGKDLTKPSYLFGTLHEGCTDVLALSKQQKKALRQVQQLYTESGGDVSIKDALTVFLMPNGQNLWDVLSAEEYQKVKRFFEGPMKAKMSDIKDFRPFMLALLIEAKAPKEKKTCKETSSEDLLAKEAKKYRVSQQYLETTADVAKVFNNISMRDEVTLLIELIDVLQPEQGNEINWTKYLAESKKVSAMMYRKYAQQDINALANLAQGGTESEVRFLSGLLEPRNRLWIPRMQKAMQNKPTFFGVGAAHLGGENGLIPLLQKEGYKVRPLPK